MANKKAKLKAKGPKMKSNRGACKRFSKTGTGLIKHASKGRRHQLSNKSRKRKRQLKKSRFMSAGDAMLVARQIPYL